MSLVTLHENTDLPPGREQRSPRAVHPMRLTRSAYFDWQGFRSRLLAAALLVPALPLMGILIVLVRLTSRGPGVFRQVRVGLHGRRFTMYKLRTMRIDAEAVTGPIWAQEHDPRVTRLGRVLRRLHLDELPQLFNALKGDMALVGPRPERPEFVQTLARQIPGYLDRLAVRPGITGLAQINLPPDADLESVRRKLILDLEYVQHANALFDLRIIAVTALRLLHLRTSTALWLLRLSRKPVVDERPALCTAVAANG